MNTAVDIMNRRVNGLGVSEAEVQTQGSDNIIVNIPKGTNSKEARAQVGTTAQLYFRPVLATEVSGSAASASPSPSASSSSSSKATDKATDKATSSSSASPTASATSQGRAVTDALKADSTPSASSSASPSASSSASPSASSSASASAAATKLQAQYAALDCTDEAQRAKAA